MLLERRRFETSLASIRTFELGSFEYASSQKVRHTFHCVWVALIHTLAFFAEATTLFIDTGSAQDLALTLKAVVRIDCQILAMAAEWCDLYKSLLVAASMQLHQLWLSVA